ncbi:hypothetical protein [Paenibacillus sp. RC84]
MNGLKVHKFGSKLQAGHTDDREKRHPSLERAPFLVFVPYEIPVG